MNLNAIINRFKLKFHSEFNTRQKELDVYEKILNGSIYDNLSPFYKEYSADDMSGEYVPLMERMPSIKYKLAKIIVNDVSSLLFGHNHFPAIKCGDISHNKTEKLLQEITRNSDLRLKMINAVRYGAVGSVAIVVKFINKKFIYEVLQTKYLSPVFNKNDPSILESIQEKRYFKGIQLIEMGYKINKDDINVDFCLTRNWTREGEFYYSPFKLSDEKEEKFKAKIDIELSSTHNLGFCPVVWIKNPDDTNEIVDGNCIFEDIIDIGFEIDYQLSQHGRLLRYNSDPILIIKDPTQIDDREYNKGTGALKLGADSDAKYLQLSDGVTKSVINYVDKLRQFALEVVRGDRSNPDKLLSGHSSKALRMLNRPLTSLVDEMRITYGEIGLINIYKIILKIINSENIDKSGMDIECDSDICHQHLTLSWGDFYPSTNNDRMEESKTLEVLVTNGLISKRTATKQLIENFGITDFEEELKAIQEDNSNLLKEGETIKKVINI